MKDLERQADEAALQKIVSEAEIAAERVLQERLKTRELYKDYVPVQVIQVYFELIEHICRGVYTRVHSIMPETIAYAKQGDYSRA